MATELESRIHSLMTEFKASNMAIDDFMRAKISAVRGDADSCANKIIETLKCLDENYASLQAAKSKGINRQEWLRGRIDSAIPAFGQGRAIAGKIIAASIDALNSSPTGTTSATSFDGMDAVDAVADLDKALTKSALGAFQSNEEAE